jgi:hypothetical protein
MARAAQPSEKLTEANISKVIELLNSEKPITKKIACEMLGIAYNTTRLASLIEKHTEAINFEKEQRAKKRYKAASPEEVSYILQSYLSGDTISDISKRIYRSPAFVTNTINRTGCPKRETGHTYFKPDLLPEACSKKEFEIGEKVFSARYNSLALIKSTTKSSDGDNVYLVWLLDEKWQQNAYQPWWELGSLEHLKQYGI